MKVLFWAPSPINDDQAYIFPTYNDNSVPPTAGPILIPLLSKEHEVTYIDTTMTFNDTVKITEEIHRHDVLCVSITQFTNYPAVREIIASVDKKKPIIAGGAFATHNAVWLCRDEMDFVVREEGEETLPELLRKIERGESVQDVMGITYRQDGTVVSNPDRPHVNMNEIPFPDFELLPQGATYKFVGLETSRGCPYGCTFCNILYRRALRSMSPQRMLEGIRHIEKYVHQRAQAGLYLLDSNMAYNAKRLAYLADNIGAYVEQPMTIGCSTSLKFCTPERNKQMRRAGFRWVNAGLEVGYASGHRIVHKVIPDDIYLTLKDLEDNGIMCLATFILGLPHETPAEVMQTIRYIQSLYKTFRNIICLVFCYRMETATSLEDFQNFLTAEAVANGAVLPTLLQEIRERVCLGALLLYNSRVGFSKAGQQADILAYFAEVEPLFANLFSSQKLIVPAWVSSEVMGDSVKGYYHYLKRYAKTVKFE
jgi:radical SAM superfamily enzyme YgiQ (UPF0313 family)